MPYRDPLEDLYANDPEMKLELQRIRALRDPESARRMQTLGAVGMLATDTGLRGFGDNAYRVGAAQEDRYRGSAEQAAEGLKQTRSRAAERADEKAWREQQRADQLAYQKQQMGLQWAQEKRMREQAAQGQWDVVPDPVRGGFVRINKRTGEMSPIEMPGGMAGAQAPQRTPGKFQMPAGIKLTETEEKSRYFAENMADSLPKLVSAVQGGYQPSRMDQFAAGPPSSGIGGKIQQNMPRSMASETGRDFYTNGRQVLASILRKESGAAITDDEWQNYGPMYLPWPGDSPEQVQAKLDKLYGMTENMATGAGAARNYWQPLEQPNWGGPTKMNAGRVNAPAAAGPRAGDRYLPGGQ